MHTHKLLPLKHTCLLLYSSQSVICIWHVMIRESGTSHCDSSTVYKAVSWTCSTHKCPETLELKLEAPFRVALPLRVLELHCVMGTVRLHLWMAICRRKGYLSVMWGFWEAFHICLLFPSASKQAIPQNIGISSENMDIFHFQWLMQKRELCLQLLLKHLWFQNFLPNCIENYSLPDLWISLFIESIAKSRKACGDFILSYSDETLLLSLLIHKFQSSQDVQIYFKPFQDSRRARGEESRAHGEDRWVFGVCLHPGCAVATVRKITAVLDMTCNCLLLWSLWLLRRLVTTVTIDDPDIFHTMKGMYIDP